MWVDVYNISKVKECTQVVCIALRNVQKQAWENFPSLFLQFLRLHIQTFEMIIRERLCNKERGRLQITDTTDGI
jgi:hypothetical protein